MIVERVHYVSELAGAGSALYQNEAHTLAVVVKLDELAAVGDRGELVLRLLTPEEEDRYLRRLADEVKRGPE